MRIAQKRLTWVAPFLLLVNLAAQTEKASGLAGTAWNAVELAGMAVSASSAAPGREPHLVFGTDGRVSGADGCNLLNGPYAVKADGITFGPVAGTQMACLKTEEIERRFRAALKGTSHWRIEKGRLQFYGATGKPLAVFERRPATGPAALQGTPHQGWPPVPGAHGRWRHL